MTELITVDQSQRWNELVRSMSGNDFYYLPEYHRMDKSGTPFLFHYSEGDLEVLYPFILRDIPGTNYKDITSVYGYAGPLTNNWNLNSAFFSEFRASLKDLFYQYQVVSVFSRLHPFFKNQKVVLDGLGDVVDMNQTVVVDLSLSEEERKKSYSDTLKYDIARGRKTGVFCRTAETREEIDVFIEIYYENMHRVSASQSFFYTKQYFYDFLKKINSKLVIAVLGGEIIGGSLVTFYNGIVQAHLAASKTSFLHLSPVKIIWDFICDMGIEEGCSWFHLGGGYGGMNDSLFLFKSCFSKTYLTFQSWRYIHDEEVYGELLGAKKEVKESKSSYFPLYRMS